MPEKCDSVIVEKQCIGCGYCCLELPCAQSIRKDGRKICSALDWNGLRHLCSLVNEQNPTLHAELAIGQGCASPTNLWRKEALRDRTKAVM